METTEPMTDEQAIDALSQIIDEPTEAEPEQETQDQAEPEEIETEAAEVDVEDDAPEVEGDEDIDEVDQDADDPTDEADDEDQSDDDSKGETLFTVKVNGEERKVTEQELKNDYSGRAALQQRHQELKTQEEQFQQAVATVQQERQAFLQFAQQARENGFKQPPKEPDPALMQTDPIGYMEAEAKYRQEAKAYQQEQQQIQRLQQEQAQQMQQRQAQMLQQQREILLQEIPELADPEKGKAIGAEWTKTAEAYGFSKEELKAVTDARTLKLLNDANKYRKLQAEKQTARQPREEARPITRPKGKMRDGNKAAWQKQLAKAMKTQSDEDFIALLPDDL